MITLPTTTFLHFVVTSEARDGVVRRWTAFVRFRAQTPSLHYGIERGQVYIILTTGRVELATAHSCRRPGRFLGFARSVS